MDHSCVCVSVQCGLHNASDNVLRFVKENFLADKSVLPVNQDLTMVSPDHRYSNIAAQRVRGAENKEYTVLYLLTGTTDHTLRASSHFSHV